MAQTAEEVAYRAQAYLSIGQTDRAADLVQTALADAPEDLGLLLTLAKTRSAQGRWAEAVEVARSAVAVDADAVPARLVLAEAALRLGDTALTAEQSEVVLARRPEDPTALLLLAASGADDRSAAGRALTRERYRLALSVGDAPWMVAMAARLEAHVGQVSEARRLVEAGLERFPTDDGLMQARLDLEPDPTEESLTVVADLLAASPTDPSLRFRYLALVAQRRRRRLAALWVAPVVTALGLTVLEGPWRFVWVAVVLFLGLGTALGGVRDAQGVPAPVRADLALRTPWDIVERGLLRLGAFAVTLGALVLAGGETAGAAMLVLAALGWVGARAAQRHRERRSAHETDDATRPPDSRVSVTAARRGAADAGPATVSVAAGRRLQALVTPVILSPLAVLSLLPASTPEDLAARATLGVVAAIVALTAILDSIGWGRLPTVRRTALVQRSVVAVFAVAAALLLVHSAGRLAEARALQVQEEPSPGGTTVPTPGPTPSISVPVPDLSGITDLPELDLTED